MNQVTIDTKQCNFCKKEFPATVIYFNKAERGTFGITAQCKECVKDYRKRMSKPIVYKITHMESQMVYIGQTIKPLKWRVSHHFTSAKEPKSPFHEFIKGNNFNKDLFKYEVLQELETKDELDEAERFWVQEYKGKGFHLFNLQDGGVDGYRADSSTRKKISEKHKGKTLTDEHSRKIVETKKRNGTFGVGYSHSEETKAIMSDLKKGETNTNLIGSKNGMAKTNEKVVLEVIKLLVQGVKPKVISEATGLSTRNISAINKRTSWKHITLEGYEDVDTYHEFRKKKDKSEPSYY